ncbi:MAG TPA: hypothetical protein VGI40_27435 [Pirellulaceae bacterium]
MISAFIFAGVLAIGQVAEKPSTSDEMAVKVRALVGKDGLGHEQMAKRDEAEKALIALGPEVLGYLPTVTPRMPAEDQVRLKRVRKVLEDSVIAAATKPSKVTLTGKMLLSQAMAEISKQTGNKVIDYRERFNQDAFDSKILVDLKAVSFWEALDNVLDEAELTLYNYDEERSTLAFTSRAENARPRVGNASYSGLFRFEPAKIEATRDLKNSAMHALRLTVEAVWEPRVTPIVIEVPLADVSAKDENGESLSINSSEGTLEVPVESNGAAAEIEFPFDAPSRSVKKLSSLKGKLVAVLLGKVETFEFADLDKVKAAELERGGVRVTVESCRKNGDIYDVSMRVRFDRAANALESHRSWIYDNECYLLDSKGRKFENAGLEATLLGVSEVGVAYKFNLEGGTPAQARLVYKTPAAIIRIPVEFEIKNVDLP